jgi:hypothetical protein
MFKHICILNVLFKIFITFISSIVMQYIIKLFVRYELKDINILDAIVLLHETLHEVRAKKIRCSSIQR